MHTRETEYELTFERPILGGISSTFDSLMTVQLTNESGGDHEEDGSIFVGELFDDKRERYGVCAG